jgi:precorrin-8X/cobalt-precorrin-8 methylmutase
VSLDYVRDGAEIYRRSFATIRAEADLSGVPDDMEKVAVRVIHACGMVDVVADLAWSPGAGAAGRAALAGGATVLTDSMMVAHGVTRARLPAANPVRCSLRDDGVEDRAAAIANTRSAAAVDAWLPWLGDAVVAVGNAPTALFRLLELLGDPSLPRPALVIGMPVGFVGAAESKQALADSGERLGVPWIVVHGRRGGSAMAAAAVNALASVAE